MNALVSSIGLTDTHFYNETGLDNDNTGVPGSKGTAQDMSKILSYLVKNDLPVYEKTKHAQITVSSPEGTYVAKNTDEVTNKIIGLLVSKTGYTDLAGGNLAIVADMGLNEPVAFVVLKSSKESRFEDILKLQNEYFAQVRKNMQ
jgi:D-alanyl-D-alanine carboxypeptidase